MMMMMMMTVDTSRPRPSRQPCPYRTPAPKIGMESPGGRSGNDRIRRSQPNALLPPVSVPFFVSSWLVLLCFFSCVFFSVSSSGPRGKTNGGSLEFDTVAPATRSRSVVVRSATRGATAFDISRYDPTAGTTIPTDGGATATEVYDAAVLCRDAATTGGVTPPALYHGGVTGGTTPFLRRKDGGPGPGPGPTTRE